MYNNFSNKSNIIHLHTKTLFFRPKVVLLLEQNTLLLLEQNVQLLLEQNVLLL